MPGKPRVIYRARTLPQAQLLKNLLAEAGISAQVSNELLADGSGVDILGWPTLARVVVDEADAPAARQMALEFDRQTSVSEAETVTGTQRPPATGDDWPTCPACGARRTTSCPFCGTSGSQFPPADPAPEDAANDEQEEIVAAPPPLLLCTTCDEPFVPRFLSRCEWCGHTFADEQAGKATAAEPDQGTNWRVTGLLLAVIGFVAATLLYFVLMWRAH